MKRTRRKRRLKAHQKRMQRMLFVREFRECFVRAGIL